jgi:hypothetical protein
VPNAVNLASLDGPSQPAQHFKIAATLISGGPSRCITRSIDACERETMPSWKRPSYLRRGAACKLSGWVQLGGMAQIRRWVNYLSDSVFRPLPAKRQVAYKHLNSLSPHSDCEASRPMGIVVGSRRGLMKQRQKRSGSGGRVSRTAIAVSACIDLPGYLNSRGE